ncbi:hypothetical protein SVA_3380 [Sulfurifustis variabilis]|uniref:SPOR domain-containing protein n=1 Tax=Sulfurifustis variabilis TaxID=1675686 RepID=A0A1C7AF82_9GAMM|nr:SPOR domain-containing protein [Sulfurifustis variabilis]BAU49922.1 hypothetical protein SVA_3380 [Sulfurifustis variabilis]
MRLFFGLLLVANLGLYMWGSWYKEPLVSYDFPRPRADVSPEKLKRLSEPGTALRARSQSRPAVAASAPAGPCYRLGPFTSLQEARGAGTRIESWGLHVEQVTEFESRGRAYQVYLPPLASREAADAKRRQLTRLGFKDHALIQEEGMENAVSVGLFTVEANARQRQRQLRAKGLDASIQPVPSLRHVYWLALPDPARDGRIGGVALTRFAEEEWAAGVSLRSAACPPAPPTDGGAQMPPG